MTIRVTAAAIKQINIAASESAAADLPLRIAATRTPDGGLDYRMGFDENGARPDDSKDAAGAVAVVVSAEDQPLLDGAVLDYVEIERGRFHFIFENPNDPSHGRVDKKPGGKN